MQRKEGLDGNNLYIGNCKLSDSQKKIAYKNPHCTEYFCNYKNIVSCTKCGNYLLDKKRLLWNKEFIKKSKEDTKYCDKNCDNGFIYDYIERPSEKGNTFNIDNYKNDNNFYNNKLIYKLDDLDYVVEYENTFPKPRTVVHWGQLKLLLEVIIFLINVIKPDDKEIHIIYAGSAPGDSILILCDMFPNIRWYLIDPRPQHKKLHGHPQVKEIITAYFSKDTATIYYNKFKNRNHKLLFLSDIRDNDTSDKAVLRDQEMNAEWHKILQPDYSYLKFRCGYESEEIYNYFKGTIFLQAYAGPASTETRILFTKNLEPHSYNINEYQGKLLYFNRVIRPSYHKKSIIHDNSYFDHCYDCTYFSYLIKNYINKFPNFNPFNTTDIFKIMKKLTDKLSKDKRDKIYIHNKDKIYVHNKHFRNNIIS